MNDNTIVLCSFDDTIKKNFNWNLVLESVESLQRHPCNASIFLFEDLASVSAYDRFICTNPADREVLDEMEKQLSRMVSDFYGKEAKVTIDNFQLKYKVEFME